MAQNEHPIPNLDSLRACLSPGLALDLVDGLHDVTSIAEASEVLADMLSTRVAAIEEGLDAAPEVA
jgi:hypothetical protein